MRLLTARRIWLGLAALAALGGLGCSSCKSASSPTDAGADLAPGPDLSAHAMLDFTPDPAECREAGAPVDPGYAASLRVQPAVVWKTKLVKGSGPLGPPVAGVDGDLLFASWYFGVVRLDNSGTIKYVEQFPGTAWETLCTSCPGVATATEVLYTMGNGELLVFKRDDGRLWMIKELDGPVSINYTVSMPVVCDTETVFVSEHIDASQSRLYKFVDGKSVFKLLLAGGRAGPICEQRGLVYLLFRNGELAALSQMGKLLWRRALAPPGSWGTGLSLGPGGLLLAGVSVPAAPSSSQRVCELVAVDRGCGAIRWRLPVKASLRSPLLVDLNGDIVFATMGGFKNYGGQSVPDYLYRVSASGRVLWSKALEYSKWPFGLQYASVGPIGADGTIYTLINNGEVVDPPGQEPRLRALSPAGDVRWELPFPDMVVSGGHQPILRRDGLLIFGAALGGPDGHQYVVAVQTRSPGMRSGVWPRGWHDDRNTSSLPSQ
jgi:outer membrane protein assembly factor BamB